jgi:hypothetical protein
MHKINLGAPCAHSHLPPPAARLHGHEDIACAPAPVFVILPRFVSAAAWSGADVRTAWLQQLFAFAWFKPPS